MRTFIKGKQTLEIGYPWLTFGAIMALEQILHSGKSYFKILEMGSGGSTVFFSQRCAELLTLEHNPGWYKKVFETVKPTAQFQFFCLPVPKLLELIKSKPDGYFDLILADSGSSYRERQDMMDASVPKLKRGGWLIIDNYANLHFDYATGWDVYTFDMFRYSGRGTRLCKKI